MARQFECMVDGCDFMVRAEDEDEIVEYAREHGQRKHPDMDVSEDEIRRNITAA